MSTKSAATGRLAPLLKLVEGSSSDGARSWNKPGTESISSSAPSSNKSSLPMTVDGGGTAEEVDAVEPTEGGGD